MTNREFILKALQQTTKKTSNSSIYASKDISGQITVYSYGWHYPLVTILDGKAFINDRGYSNSTSKHIGHAWAAGAQIVGWGNCYHAPLFDGNSLTKSGIVRSASAEITRLEGEMAAKKRKDTQVYGWLETQRERMSATLEACKELA
jgi:hypothetical protein